MIKHITIIIYLISSTFIYSQYEFGISRSDLINNVGVPDDIRGANNDIYEYQKISPSLEFSVENYFFNDYDELKEVQIIYMSDCYQAKEKLNQLLSLAKNKYLNSGMKDNQMVFRNPDSQEGYIITMVPKKLGKSCYAEERYISITHF